VACRRYTSRKSPRDKDYERKFAAWVAAIVGSGGSGSIPFPTLTTIGGVKAATAPTHQFQRGIDTSGNPLFAQPAAGDISGLGTFATATSIAVGSITGLGSLATLSSIDLASQATGNLGVTHLNSGIDANSSHFWRGDGTWATPTALPGGSSGQVQFNSAGAFGGFTVGGDGTLDVTTGALTITKTGGIAFGPAATIASTVGTGSVALSANPSFTGTAVFSTISASTAGITTATIVTAHTTNLDATTATLATATVGALTTNTVTGGFAKLVNTSNTGQLSLSGTGLDNGANILGYSTNTLDLAGGALFNGTNWIAKDTTANLLTVSGGVFGFYSDTGLTIGNTFGPTIRFGVDATGTLTNGTVPAARTSGFATVATSGSAADLSGTLALARFGTQSANLVLSGPSSGAAANPTFRALVGADLPNPGASSLGGIRSLAAITSKWINTISTSGVPSATQPTTADLAGVTKATWTPTDASGAGLTLTSVDCVYQTVGNFCTILFDITFPTTASGSTALVNGLPAPGAAASATAGGAPAYTTSTTAFTILITTGGGMNFYTYGGTPLTNANLSGKSFRGSITYLTA
jgi:hypothetical protein